MQERWKLKKKQVTAATNMGREPSPSHTLKFNRLGMLKKNDIWIGVPRSSGIEHCRPFPIQELELRRESLPSEQIFRFLIEHSHSRMLWHVAIDDVHESKPFSSDDWRLFVSLLAETSSHTHALVLAYDRSVEYSSSLLDSIECLREELTGIPILLDTEHTSWKTRHAEQVMKSLKLPHVFIDGPNLPGIIKNATYQIGPLAVLRCVGRNNRMWFEHLSEERFAYTYSESDLLEIAQRVKRLRESHDQVYVIFCNRPPTQAIANALELGEILVSNG